MKESKKGRALDAEPDNARKISRFMSATGVNLEQAKRLAEYDESVYEEMSPEKRLGAEKIQGKTVDFVDISFLELARIAGNTVGRVAFHNNRPHGTGFMISKDLFLTNNHVIPNRTEAKKLRVQFDYELNVNQSTIPTTSFSFDPDKFFLTDPENELDFTIIAIGDKVEGQKKLSNFGYCSLLDNDGKHVLSEFVNIIQHPNGNYKQVVLRENQIVGRLETFLYYSADTMGGSSGSPVFNDEWQAIALHHWGGSSRPSANGKHRGDINEGVRISSIVKELKSRAKKIDGDQLSMLNAVLNPASERLSMQSSWNSFNHSIVLSQGEQDGTKIRIPLEISIQVGNSQKYNNVGSTSYDNQGIFPEKVKIDIEYSNRAGYDKDFLPNWTVYPPALTKKLEKNVARKIGGGTGEESYELKYEHFSVVMNAKRRLAFLSAVNIDGKIWMRINRDTGKPAMESAEGTETWYEDPRIKPKHQCEQSLYDEQKPFMFDRGHLVMRIDSTWGDAVSATRANADTFHFANCTPQYRSFNRSGIWRKIENYVIGNSKEEEKRISVFAGCVFEKNDPKYRSIRIPKQYWKVLCREKDGELLTMAFLADQSKFLTRLSSDAESFDDTEKVDEYQTSIDEIEQLTGLDFSNLRDFDTFNTVGAEKISRVKLERVEDLII